MPGSSTARCNMTSYASGFVLMGIFRHIALFPPQATERPDDFSIRPRPEAVYVPFARPASFSRGGCNASKPARQRAADKVRLNLDTVNAGRNYLTGVEAAIIA